MNEYWKSTIDYMNTVKEYLYNKDIKFNYWIHYIRDEFELFFDKYNNKFNPLIEEAKTESHWNLPKIVRWRATSYGFCEAANIYVSNNIRSFLKLYEFYERQRDCRKMIDDIIVSFTILGGFLTLSGLLGSLLINYAIKPIHCFYLLTWVLPFSFIGIKLSNYFVGNKMYNQSSCGFEHAIGLASSICIFLCLSAISFWQNPEILLLHAGSILLVFSILNFIDLTYGFKTLQGREKQKNFSEKGQKLCP